MLRIPAVPRDALSWKLMTEWVVPTGGCIDSSPLVVRSRGNDVAYVGSHSGLVLCAELRGGVIKWRTQLRGRVESSPCVSNCGEYIVFGNEYTCNVHVLLPFSLILSLFIFFLCLFPLPLSLSPSLFALLLPSNSFSSFFHSLPPLLFSGCYDGCLYSLCSSTGGIHWCFATKGSSTLEPIKSSPLPHPRTGFIWFGSHDQHLYAIDIHVSKSHDCHMIKKFSLLGEAVRTCHTFRGRGLF